MDVFQVVKALRVFKPGAVPSVVSVYHHVLIRDIHHTQYPQDNYKDIFETVLVYLDSFDTYANFF